MKTFPFNNCYSYPDFFNSSQGLLLQMCLYSLNMAREMLTVTGPCVSFVWVEARQILLFCRALNVQCFHLQPCNFPFHLSEWHLLHHGFFNVILLTILVWVFLFCFGFQFRSEKSDSNSTFNKHSNSSQVATQSDSE